MTRITAENKMTNIVNDDPTATIYDPNSPDYVGVGGCDPHTHPDSIQVGDYDPYTHPDSIGVGDYDPTGTHLDPNNREAIGVGDPEAD